jgi:hypothetical protein
MTSSKKPKSFKVCPRCRSSKIKFSSNLDLWLTPKQYLCKNCGYIGPIILELEKLNENNK